MNRSYALLPALAGVALLFAAPIGHAATDMSTDWQNYEQAYGGGMPPKSEADCTRYTSDAVKAECLGRLNRQPIFHTYASDSRANADQAAIRYCTMLGKTYEMKGQSADSKVITYTCK
jgi:hypothetical protein